MKCPCCGFTPVVMYQKTPNYHPADHWFCSCCSKIWTSKELVNILIGQEEE